MKIETIKHPSKVASCVSDSMADNFKDKLSEAQHKILSHNVYTIEEDDAIFHDYHGCGCGWVEFDKAGEPVKLRYLDENIVELSDNGLEEWDDEYYEFAIVSSSAKQEEYLLSSQKEQNMFSIELKTEQLIPLFLEDGNVRVLVNFSSYQLVRF